MAYKTCVAIDERSLKQALGQKITQWFPEGSKKDETRMEEPDVETVDVSLHQPAELETQTEDVEGLVEEPEEPEIDDEPESSNTTASTDVSAMCNQVFETIKGRKWCRTSKMSRKDVEKLIAPEKLPKDMTCQ